LLANREYNVCVGGEGFAYKANTSQTKEGPSALQQSVYVKWEKNIYNVTKVL
jgi:hypothetical protein